MRTILSFIIAFFLVVTMCVKFWSMGYHAGKASVEQTE